MLSALKNEKYIWSMNPGGDFETSMVRPLIISVDLVKIQTMLGYYKSGKFVGRPFMSPFLAIRFSLII